MTAFLSFFLTFILAADSQVGGRTSPDGAEQIQIDLPGKEQLKNVGGRDGAGLCVFTSLEHSGRWQNVEQLTGFQNKMKKEEGGGWPEKVDKMVQKYAAGITYLQYQGDDPSLLKLALKTGRMPAVTYGYSPRYSGSGRIAHMVNLVHLTPRWAAVLDNNFPGETNYEWMSPAEFTRRWKLGGGGWAVFLLSPPPPPPPANKVFYQAPEPTEQDPEEAPISPLFGVDTSRLGQNGCYLNGRKISSLDALRALEGGELTDDSHKLRITIISQDTAAASKVKSDLEGSPWAPVLLVQTYPPTHWAVSDVGFNTEGTPRIIVQGPPNADGSASVLHSQADYSDGLDGLIGALRRKAPNYDPQKDKDGRKGPDAGAGNILAIARAVTITAFIAFFLGYVARGIIPAVVAALKAAHGKVFPAKPSMEEMILNALKKLKEQEADNVKRNNDPKPS
jgi:hypothetical protein